MVTCRAAGSAPISRRAGSYSPCQARANAADRARGLPEMAMRGRSSSGGPCDAGRKFWIRRSVSWARMRRMSTVTK